MAVTALTPSYFSGTAGSSGGRRLHRWQFPSRRAAIGLFDLLLTAAPAARSPVVT